MALFRYFADQADGTVREWRDRVVPHFVDRAGIQRTRVEYVRVQHEGGGIITLFDAELDARVRVRQVQFKANPSLHRCSPRCSNAKGHQCECACWGKNHGRGSSLVCEAVSLPDF